MKLNKEFKSEVDNGFREGDYVGRKIAIRILSLVIIIGIVSSAGYLIYGKWKTNADRQIFKQSTTYNESATDFIAKSYAEYNTAETEEDKKSIKKYVANRYPNLDTSKIENPELVKFYNKCIGGF